MSRVPTLRCSRASVPSRRLSRPSWRARAEASTRPPTRMPTRPTRPPTRPTRRRRTSTRRWAPTTSRPTAAIRARRATPRPTRTTRATTTRRTPRNRRIKNSTGRGSGRASDGPHGGGGDGTLTVTPRTRPRTRRGARGAGPLDASDGGPWTSEDSAGCVRLIRRARRRARDGRGAREGGGDAMMEWT